ncbi:cytochrome P450 [Xanthomonas sp. AmX2]|uniref:cytochrome P450 n=1 Tax=Xanthomonas sp. TaxID=29446 RepID=UPI00197E30FE|nr:cytochrome P450 [Xanthomonas sp.]MBN6150843.1 cytochrome P450 [Xanthomonas sp.]
MLLSSSPQRDALPRAEQFDVSAAMLRDGYAFVSRQCERLGSDVFQARVLLRKAIFARGADAVAAFYHPGRFTRRGALPPTTVALLQGFGSVQRLDGDAHLHRKQLFRGVLTPEATARLVAIFRQEWQVQAQRWTRSATPLVLQREAELVLCRAVCRWAGVPLADAHSAQRAREFAAMIDGAGSAAMRWLRGWRLRRRNERWIRSVIGDLRRAPPSTATPAQAIAHYRGPDGKPLGERVAAVELINLLRPTVAVARWITFSALALHEHPELRRRLRAGEPGLPLNLVQEVRRYYPFFPMVGGRVRVPFQWRGRQFRRGEWMMVDLYGTNHDPRVWRHPERFDPDRFRDWDGGACNFVPQGGGDVDRDHRCPGEDPSIALLLAAIDELAVRWDYRVPAQDLRYPLDRFPSLPRSGFVIEQVRPAAQAEGSGCPSR